MVEIALNSGSQLVGLIDGLLEAERLASGEPLFVLAACDAGALLRQAGTMVGAAAAQADVTLEIIPCQAMLNADADHLRQALVILLTSAIESAVAGSQVRLQAQDEGETLAIRLSLEAPWPALVALAQPTMGVLSKAELTHMDMLIARLVIERHGGRLWVEAGSAVCLSLPIAQNADGPLILVCDEDPGFHEVVEAFLLPRGMRVLGVTDAQAMLALAQTHTPAVILLSEEQATAEVYQALREPGPMARVPIVRMGVCGVGADDEAAYHLIKPFKKADLIAVIGRAMGATAGGAP
jgi:CheY-like chemotaxis protein